MSHYRLYWLVVPFVLLFYPYIGKAGTLCGTEERSGTLVVYGNGIMSSPEDMGQSLVLILIRLHDRLPQEESSQLTFDLARNKSYGFFRDLYESAKQKLGIDNTLASFWRWVSGLDPMPDVLQERAKELAAQFDFATRVAPEDLNNHVALYRSSILEGKKVVVVSHSQGNFFANAAYDRLFYGDNALEVKESFGIVAVATPASFVAGDGPYTTLVEDGVILAVSVASVAMGTQPPLGPNLTNVLSGATTSDIYGHMFVREYMAEGSRSAEKITGDIINTIQSLVQPTALARDGVITITLTWGIQPDIDLHTFEPNGTHVYYMNKAGVSGYLDVDDISSYGPEHYYVSCDTLETGTYRVGVNYFSGYAPEVAHVQVRAGTSIRSFDVSLQSARGPSGNDNPIPVADITVSGNAQDGYSFAIQSTVSEENTAQ